LILRELRQITVVGLGLLGGSIALVVLHTFAGVKIVGYSHRSVTRRKARRLAVADEISGDIRKSVSNADLVILATPIGTFEKIFGEISDALPNGCIVTDVGSTKVLPHSWAVKELPETVYYVGSHPIAGSEQRGIEFARDDLFERAVCILTTTTKTNHGAVRTLKKFWSRLGCCVKLMRPVEHDRILANVSHLPHIAAVSLMNASSVKELPFAGKGFMDMSRIASSPTNIWADVLATNESNVIRSIDRITAELGKLKRAIKTGAKKQIEELLEAARSKRSALIKYKIKKKELIS
jgi:prephenate dehydrogenase